MVSTFADKYKSAIIFLAFLFIVSIILVLIYMALKREMCNCTENNKRADDEESLYAGPEKDDDNGSFKNHILLNERRNSRPTPPSPTSEQLQPIGSIEDHSVITQSKFEQPSKKRDFIKFTLKKIKPKSKKQSNGSIGNSGRVRFATNENSCLIEGNGNRYGSTGMKRADSMESFESGISTITSTVEEFGEELSPSRLQVFIKYEPKTWLLVIGAKQGDCLISSQKEKMYWQVHVTLMPFKKHKFKTKYKSTTTPVFNQNYNVENIPAQSLAQMSVRYRVYGKQGKSGRKKIAGETEIELTHLLKMKDYCIKDWRILRRQNDPYYEVRQESLV